MGDNAQLSVAGYSSMTTTVLLDVAISAEGLVRVQVLQELASRNVSSPPAWLYRCLENEAERVRLFSAMVLLNAVGREHIAPLNTLRGLLTSQDSEIRFFSARSLRLHPEGQPLFRQEMSRLLADEYFGVRLQCIEFVSDNPFPSTYPAQVVATLRDDPSEIIRVAVKQIDCGS